ncbi:MAG: hypothetical protein OEL20_04840 [Sulfuritalea sp.]|nr:hypothetical protein [Sulfuritalea sp.]
MDDLFGQFGVDVVMTHADINQHCVTLLRLRKAPVYAVCRVHPTLEVATAPRFDGEHERGTLSGAISSHGMKDLLDWTDRGTAVDRYRSMVSADASSRALQPLPWRGTV